MPDIASLGLSVDSSGASRAAGDLDAFKQAARGAADAADDFGNTTTAASAKAEAAARKVRSAYEAARSAIDPLYASSQKYASALTALSAATEAGIISQQDLTRLNDMAAQKYLASTEAAKRKAAAEREAAAASKTAAAAERQAARERQQAEAAASREAKRAADAAAREAARQAAAAEREAARAAKERAQAEKEKQREISKAAAEEKRMADALEQTRRSVDPLYASNQRLAESIRLIDAARDAQMLTEQEYWRLRQQLTDANQAAVAANHELYRSFSGSSYALTNFSYQVQDMIVQVASGTDFLRAFAQQAPQALGALGFSGKFALFGSLAGTAVAGIAAILPLLLKTGDSAEEAKKRMDELASAVSEYSEAAEQATKTSDQLVGSFGRFAGSQHAFNQTMASFARADAVDKLDASVDKLSTRFGSLGNEIVYVDGYVMKAWEQTVYKMQDSLGITSSQARTLGITLNRLGQAQTLEQQTVAAESFASAMMNSFGSIEKMPKEIRAIVQEATKLGELSAELAKDWEQIANDRRLNDMFAEMVERANMNIELANEAAAAEQAKRDAAAEFIQEQMVQAQMAEAIYLYGEDSAQVEILKRNAAIQAAEEFAAQHKITGALKDALVDAAAAAYDASNAAAAGLSETQRWANAASLLAANLWGASDAARAAASNIGAMIAERNREAGLLTAPGGFDPFSREAGMGVTTAAGGGSMEEQISFGTAWTAHLAEQERLAREAARKGRGGKGRKPGKSDAEKEAERDEKRRRQEAERWFERTRTDTERLQVEQKELNDLYKEGYFGEYGSIAAMEILSRGTQQLLDQYDPLAKAMKEWKDEFKSGIVDSIMGAESLSDAMLKVADSIMRAAWEATLFGEGPLASMWGGVFGDKGMLGGLFDGFLANAKGNVYSSPSLSAYSSQVVDKPTFFAFARGAGVMGEAGPEAIMPLMRGPDGRLGVSAKKDPNATSNSRLGVDLRFDKGDIEVSIRDAMGNVLAKERQSIIGDAIKGSGKAMKDTKTFGRMR